MSELNKPKKRPRRNYWKNPELNEKKCPKCGRTFIAAPQHVFKVGGKYYCSWTCYNHRNDKEVKNENDKD